jgi:hypothetical protein
MANDRLRVPVEADYVAAIGLFTYAFARLEWDAIWCCERMKPGYIHDLAKKTAGKIAHDLLTLFEKHPDPAIREVGLPAAMVFTGMVEIRNSLVHGKPFTAGDEKRSQRLSRHGYNEGWTIDTINVATDSFVRAAGNLNHMLYHELKA